MHGGHDHDHDHASVHAPVSARGAERNRLRRRLTWACALTTLYLCAEVAGGLWTGSLALLADAGHMFSDAAALGISLFAMRMAERPATATRTFGFHRTEILAALANGAALMAIAGMIVVEALERFSQPAPVTGLPMLAIACGGLVMNVAALGLLHGDHAHNLNARGAFLHVALDALGSVGAIVAGLLIWRFGWLWADPLASMLIAILVCASSWSLMRESVAVLMEGSPAHVDVDELRGALEALPGVEEVHDLHVWLITSGMPSTSAHLRVAPDTDGDAFLARAGAMLSERFAIQHSTLQLERREDVACRDCAAQ